jgi:anti-sigma regulatory factor (Ser/Thr protein kinase)
MAKKRTTRSRRQPKSLTPTDSIEAFIDAGQTFSTGEVAGLLGVSRQMAHRRLSALVDSGRLIREGAGRGAHYRSSGSLPFHRRYLRAGLAEDRVWDEMRQSCVAIANLSGTGMSTFQYAFTEMLNNAIDHSGAKRIDIMFEAAGDAHLAFEIIDDGIGVFAHLRERFGHSNDLEAVQQLSKGKLTTMPEAHSGEGVFFTSKAARTFELESGGTRWRVDNDGGDYAVGTVPRRKGTRVRFEGPISPVRTLAQLFEEYTEDFEFSHSKVVIKLFAIGSRFISRSEGKRVVQGLERFRSVELDFKGVEEIGQGFADEVFRVWTLAHPEIVLLPTHMNEPVAFMVSRARKPPMRA